MKKILLLAVFGLLNPVYLFGAAQETRTTKGSTHKTTKAKKNGTKKDTKKSGTAQPKAKRVKSTTAGKSSTATTKAKKHTTKANTSKKPRTKTTTAGTKAKSASAAAASKAKNTTTPRKARTSYKNKATAQPKSTAAQKKASQPKVTRVYHKGGVKYRQFNRLNEMHAENFGVISTPTTKTVALNKPGRGYVNANLINLTTDGKQGRLLFDTHDRTAAQAQKKGLGNSATKSVEVYAGTDSSDLALMGEYPLAKDSENVQVNVDPSGQVMLSSNGIPFTKFSIHQHQK